MEDLVDGFTAVIPARGGSKGIPRKNIKPLYGKPLIQWTIDFAKEFKGFYEIFVSTEDLEIGKLAMDNKVQVLRRPSGLADDTTPIKEVLHYHSSKIKTKYTVLLQPTSPFRRAMDLRMMCNKISSGDFNSLISVNRVPDKYNPGQVVIGKGFLLTMADGRAVEKRITRRQDFPNAFVPSGSIYIMETENLRRAPVKMYGDSVGYHIDESFININTPEDWEEAEKYAQTFFGKVE